MDETGKGSEGSRAKKEEMLDAGEQMRNVAARAQEKRPKKDKCVEVVVVHPTS